MLRDGAGNGLSERPRSSTRIGSIAVRCSASRLCRSFQMNFEKPGSNGLSNVASRSVAGGGTTGFDHRQSAVPHRNHLQVAGAVSTRWSGGAGEKQLLLSQLAAILKGKDINEIAAGIRNWRRHYGRAQEVDATLPDGVLLLKALDVPLGQHDPQAAFRLSRNRMQLHLDQQPTHENLWAFSQCLLAKVKHQPPLRQQRCP